MEFGQQAYQQLLNRVHNQEILKNEKEIKVWSQYKAKHEKVIEGLQTVLPELSVNCVVPIGKKALMKGKITNTNEVLACIGDGYFVKYSNHQAIALCKRRIKKSDEMLKKLEKERDFLESRQILPFNYGAFGSDECKDLLEHWDEKKLSDWRVEHRKKEIEYRQKLSCEKNTSENISHEKDEDLFARLDELELEEELNNELHGLDPTKDKTSLNLQKEISLYDQPKLLSENLNEVEKNERKNIEQNSEDKRKENAINVEKKINKDIIQENSHGTQTVLSTNLKDEISTLKKSKINGKFEVSIIKEEDFEKTLQRPNYLANSSNSVPLDFNSDHKKQKNLGRRVSFATPDSDKEESNCKNDSNSQCDQVDLQSDNLDLTDEINDDVIKIDFIHSEIEAEISEAPDGTILSPKDIYKVFCKPKSILKKTSGAVNINYNYLNISTIDESCETENEDRSFEVDEKKSIYNFVIQDVQEKKVDNRVFNDTESTTQENKVNDQISSVSESSNTQKPVSRFRIGRANLKK